MSKRKLTVQDIILIQKQLEAAEQLNNLLGDAVTEIGEAVSGIDIAAVENQNAAEVLNKVKTVVAKLEKQVEDFAKRLK